MRNGFTAHAWRRRLFFAALVGVAAGAIFGARGPRLGVGAASAADAPAANEDTYRAIGALLARRLPREHLSRLPLDATMGNRAFDLFMAALDPERAYFTAAEIARWRAEAAPFERHLREGDLTFARRSFERLRERARDRLAFAERFLADLPEPDAEAVYRWRRRDEPWPADDAARDELWRRKLWNEIVARQVAMRLAEEDAAAKKKPAASAPQEEAEGALEEPNLAPAEFVLKRYRQYLQVLEDSDDEFISDRFFSAFTQAYDPHSEFLSAVRSEDFDINMKLSLVGIGAVLSTEDGMARIVRLIPGGPAERDGRLRPNDRIVAVAQGNEPPVDVLHWPLYKVVRLIRGEIGTRVTLTVWPASDLSGASERRIELVRDEVKLEDKAARGVVREVPAGEGSVRRLAVVTLPEFYADFKGMNNGGAEARRSSRDVRNIIRDLQAKGGFEGLLLDLRNNGGGSLPDAIELAGLFIRSGPVLQVRDARSTQVLTDPDPAIVYDGPLVVLVNRLSASASEIVAAALQDYRRAVIVGDSKTHGKGTVQSLQPLAPRDPALGQIKVTTAAFYRIAGGSTQRRGVEADIVLPSFLDVTEVGEEYLPHALDWSVIEPTFFTVFARAIPDLEKLRAASERRRRGDPRFEAWDRTREQIAQRVRSAEIPLRLEARLALARAERELERLQSELESDAEPDADDGKDLVLEEGLRILADMVAERETRAAPKPDPEKTEPVQTPPAANAPAL